MAVLARLAKSTIRSGSVATDRISTIALALTAFVTCASASDEIPIEGQYLQNRPCKGERSEPAGLKVTIGAREITYSGGICSIDSRRNEESKIILGVTCKFRSGATMGADIAFTRLNDHTLHMVQQDGSFEADLHKCAK
jgi:hypothetical protein